MAEKQEYWRTKSAIDQKILNEKDVTIETLNERVIEVEASAEESKRASFLTCEALKLQYQQEVSACNMLRNRIDNFHEMSSSALFQFKLTSLKMRHFDRWKMTTMAKIIEKRESNQANNKLEKQAKQASKVLENAVKTVSEKYTKLENLSKKEIARLEQDLCNTKQTFERELKTAEVAFNEQLTRKEKYFEAEAIQLRSQVVQITAMLSKDTDDHKAAVEKLHCEQAAAAKIWETQKNQLQAKHDYEIKVVKETVKEETAKLATDAVKEKEQELRNQITLHAQSLKQLSAEFENRIKNVNDAHKSELEALNVDNIITEHKLQLKAKEMEYIASINHSKSSIQDAKDKVATCCLARLGDFDLTWKDTGDNWHTCPGSPFNYPNAVGPKSFVCQTNLKAKAIKIQQHKDDYMNMAEVEIYSTCTDDNVCLQNKPDFTSTADCASASNSAYCQPNANAAYRHAVLSCCFHTCGICSDPVQSITATTAATWTGELAGTGIGTSFPDSIYPFSCNTAGCGAFAPKLAPAVPVDPPATATVQIVDGNTLTFTATGGTNNGGAAVSEFMVKEEGTPSEVDITGCEQSSTADYNCDMAYTGGDSHTTGGSNQWLRFDFAATFIHSVNIDVYHGMDDHLKHFDLTWQDDSDNTWHTCVGSPYNLVSYYPTTFACPTTNGRARAIKISPTATTASIQITSIKVYARVFNDLGTVPASGGGNIMKAGYGASPKTFFLLSCNFLVVVIHLLTLQLARQTRQARSR